MAAKKRRSKIPAATTANLQDYRRKRDFSRTAEPRGGDGGVSPSGWFFCVQKHAARALHYDLRLQLDGTLKSWAVPKGPSLDPRQKPLAVHTEDHPIEYGDFEGVIPEGEYGGGTVMLWDCGEWEPIGDPHEGLAAGDLKFVLHGEKLGGAWVLARMGGKAGEGGKNWLLIKKQDTGARPLESYNVLAELPFSVASGRTMEEVAASPDAVWRDGAAHDAESSDDASAEPATPRETALPDPAVLSGARAAALPAKMKPQLCVTARRAPGGDEWLHEVKLDGYRLMCRIERGDVRLYTRNGHDWTGTFPAVARAAGRLPIDAAWLDGEVVVLGAGGMPDFGALQSGLRGGKPQSFTYFVFDVPWAGGYDLKKVPLIERKAYLAELADAAPQIGPTIQICEHLDADGPTVFAHAAALGLEGIISKRINAPYVEQRSDSWIKIKNRLRQEFVVGGFTAPAGSRTGFGALLVGHHDATGGLVYRGRVGTGFNEQTLTSLDAELRERERDAPPFCNPEADPDLRTVRWVEPELVVEVEFATWTNDGLLRHPVYLGRRDDVDPREVYGELTPEEADGASQPIADAVTEEPATDEPVVTVAAKPTEAVFAGVRISHPERTVYPEARVSKGEVAAYYEAVAERILPHVTRRPLSLVRCPLGLAGESFFQRHLGDGFPKSIRGITTDETIDGEPYVVIDDLTGLISLAQMGVLEIHTWGCREDDLERPDQLVFDLDPGPGILWEHLVASAEYIRDALEDLGLCSFVKTTGGAGLHLVVPITRRSGWPDAKAFTHAVAVELVRRAPRNFVATMAKAFRGHRIYIDYLRNTRGATAVAPYSTRARPGACVSTPLSWEELSADHPPSVYTVRTVPARVAEADPWADFRTTRQSVTKAMRSALALD